MLVVQEYRLVHITPYYIVTTITILYHMQVYSRLHKLNITISSSSLNNLITTLGKNFDGKVKVWKKSHIPFLVVSYTNFIDCVAHRHACMLHIANLICLIH